jgi:hypothetical protein
MKGNNEVLALRERWFTCAKTQTLQTLPVFLKELSEFTHDYNTICYAVAASAVAAAWAMDNAPNGGITGFQAGAVMWEFMREWNHVIPPAWLLQGVDMLYPQNDYKFRTIPHETWEWLQQEANKRLKETGFPAHPTVIAHWREIAAGFVPFGLSVRSSNLVKDQTS